MKTDFLIETFKGYERPSVITSENENKKFLLCHKNSSVSKISMPNQYFFPIISQLDDIYRHGNAFIDFENFLIIIANYEIYHILSYHNEHFDKLT